MILVSIINVASPPRHARSLAALPLLAPTRSRLLHYPRRRSPPAPFVLTFIHRHSSSSHFNNAARNSRVPPGKHFPRANERALPFQAEVVERKPFRDIITLHGTCNVAVVIHTHIQHNKRRNRAASACMQMNLWNAPLIDYSRGNSLASLIPRETRSGKTACSVDMYLFNTHRGFAF